MARRHRCGTGTRLGASPAGLRECARSVAIAFAVALSCAGAGARHSVAQPCLSSWRWAMPSLTGNYLRGVAWGRGTFVAVGDKGTVVTSPDGMTWTARGLGGPFNLLGVTFDGSRFVAVGSDRDRVAYTLTSDDGAYWSVASSDGIGELYAVGHGNSLLVAVGWRSILTSPDGLRWTVRANRPGLSLVGVAYSGSRFVAVGTTGSILTSPDALTWSEAAYRSPVALYGVASDGARFVAVGDLGTVLVSTDGTNWSPQLSGTKQLLTAVASTQWGFVAVGTNGTVLASPDGARWSAAPPPTSQYLVSVASGAPGLVAVGPAGTIVRASDPARWSPVFSAPPWNFGGIVYTPQGFVVLGSFGNVYTSPDGAAWKWQARTDLGDEPNAITWSSGRFVAVGSHGLIASSSDALTWSWALSPTASELLGVTWGGGRFVAVGRGGTIVTSLDGSTWTLRNSGTGADLLSVAAGPSQLVAVGANSVLLTSPDGAVWTRQTLDPNLYLRSVAYGSGGFVAAGSGGILVSSDGVTWTSARPGFDLNLFAVAYGMGTFVAVGADGATLTSPDGRTWTSWPSPTRDYLLGVAAGGGRLVAAGSDMIIQASTCASASGSIWVPVVSHTVGAQGSVWRSDLGALNAAEEPATVEVRLHEPARVTLRTVTVGAKTQAVFSDVAGAFGAASSAPLEVAADRGVSLTARTYSAVPFDAGCLASGTAGQDFEVSTSGAALASGGVGWLPNLREDAAFRTNIGLTNAGTNEALVGVSLFDDAGTELGSFTRTLGPGEWSQEFRPFYAYAGALDVAGYARLTVLSGSGVIAYASVVDNVTNDPTTVSVVSDESRDTDLWIPVASRKPGLRGTEWRSDLAVLNPSATSARVEVRWQSGGVVRTLAREVRGGTQLRFDDLVGQLGATGSGPVEVRSDQRVIAHSRSCSLANDECAQGRGGTVGQSYAGVRLGQTIAAGQDAWLPQLAEDAAHRTNIGFTNTGPTPALLAVTLFDGSGAAVVTFVESVSPGEFLQEGRVFARLAGRDDLARGYARVHVETGSGVVVHASVIDNVTNDPTTVAMVR